MVRKKKKLFSAKNVFCRKQCFHKSLLQSILSHDRHVSNNGIYSTFPCLGLKVVKVCKHWQVTFPSWLKSSCQTFTTHCVVTVASLLSTRLTRHTAGSGGEVRPLGISCKLVWFNRNFFLWKSQRQNYKKTHNTSYCSFKSGLLVNKFNRKHMLSM